MLDRLGQISYIIYELIVKEKGGLFVNSMLEIISNEKVFLL